MSRRISGTAITGCGSIKGAVILREGRLQGIYLAHQIKNVREGETWDGLNHGNGAIVMMKNKEELQ